ncbi:hypothetical protein GUJ93_ZPchr0008g11514 [Zizania palustris]|uniref:Uncharacterized protein n=1 Tax=Zizania palustris TaxID=103762 RepID=A0A8J5VHD9_ZIZPA|nr:hypothetical protein GUJ93_ZPchr0008g11514 [Zizania palustris]
MMRQCGLVRPTPARHAVMRRYNDVRRCGSWCRGGVQRRGIDGGASRRSIDEGDVASALFRSGEMRRPVEARYAAGGREGGG